jgi:TonB family protein
MDNRFRHRIKVTTILHFTIVVLLMILPVVFSWFIKRRDRNSIMFVDFTVAIPGDTTLPVEREFKPATDTKNDMPDASQPKSKSKVQKSTKLVKRSQVAQGGTTRTSNLSPEEIRRLLAAGARISDRTSIPDDYQIVGYYNIVRQAMYDAWIQPSSLAGTVGLSAEVEIRVQRNGGITQRNMTRRSGNSLMDDSVMKAVHSVSMLRPLPPEFPGAYKDITITFELTTGGG